MIPSAARVIDLLKLDQVDGIFISGVGSVAYSYSFPLPFGNPSFSFEYQADTEGTTALKLELEQGNQEPTTELSSDAAFVVPDGAAELNNTLADELNHIKAYEPAATAFARMKIIGNATNDTTTITKLKAAIIDAR